jgi:HrpA-like RNA helicase
MSATLQESVFQRYFNNCPILYVSGRTYPVDNYYLDDIYNLLKRQRAQIRSGPVQSSSKAGGRDTGSSTEGGEYIDEPKFDPELIKDLIVKIVSTPNLASKHRISL